MHDLNSASNYCFRNLALGCAITAKHHQEGVSIPNKRGLHVFRASASLHSKTIALRSKPCYVDDIVPPESGLKHKPFSLLRNAVTAANAPAPKPTHPASADKPPLGRVIVREEFDTTEAAIITRVIGVPREHATTFGKQWRELLGKTVVMEGRDLLLMTGDFERIATLLRNAGAGEVVVVRRQPAADLSNAGEAGGTQRAQIRRGLRVAIVLKADQDSGTLTEGIVQDILTSSATHPRGIKVRLESGQVGRVHRIFSR